MEEPRSEKVAVVTEVRERLESSTSVLVTEYRGLTVKALAELRRSLRPAGGAYKVYKNTLVRRAAAEAGIDLEEHLVGPTALTFTETTPDGEPGDVVIVAKALKEFSKTNPEMVIKGGLLDGAPIDAAGISKLAELDSREVLLAKLAGLMAAPMQQFAGLLQAVPRDFAYGLSALIEKGGGPDAAPSEEAPAPEAAPEAEAASDEVAPAAEAATDDSSTEDQTEDTTDDQTDGAEAAEAAPSEEAPAGAEDGEE